MELCMSIFELNAFETYVPVTADSDVSLPYLVLFNQTSDRNKHDLLSYLSSLSSSSRAILGQSGYRPQCFHPAALVGGCSNVTLPYSNIQKRN
eukprot:1120205-Pelagomonas_calceolata.AAC.1